MTDQLSIGLTKLLRKAQMADDVDFLREGMRVFSEAVMELEVRQHVGAERHAHPGAHRATQWLPGTTLGYPHWDD